MSAKLLTWELDEYLSAKSRVYEVMEGMPLRYCVEPVPGERGKWQAKIEGVAICTGELAWCLTHCEANETENKDHQ